MAVSYRRAAVEGEIGGVGAGQSGRSGGRVEVGGGGGGGRGAEVAMAMVEGAGSIEAGGSRSRSRRSRGGAMAGEDIVRRGDASVRHGGCARKERHRQTTDKHRQRDREGSLQRRIGWRRRRRQRGGSLQRRT